jgi:hypothetical protein
MKLKNVYLVGGIISLVILILFIYPKNLGKIQSTDVWSIFEDKNLGLTFSYPAGLKPFYPKAVNFRECEECPGIIDIESEETAFDTPEQAIRNTPYSQEKITSIVEIGDKKVLVAGDSDADRIFFVDKNRLFVISLRSIDTEKFLKTIRTMD